MKTESMMWLCNLPLLRISAFQYPDVMKTVKVSAAVIYDGDRFLAAERGYGEWKGFWEFPGGKREEDETGEEAVIREIREELCVIIAVDGFICTVEHDYPAFHLSMDVYASHIVEGTIDDREHLSLRWLSADDADTVRWLPADLKIIPAVLKYS